MTEYVPLLLAAAAALAVVALFLVIRALLDRRRRPGDEEESIPLFAEATQQPPANWEERVDRAFQHLVQNTGLGLTPGQALGIIALGGVCLGGALLLWRGDLLLVGAGLALGLIAPFVFFLIARARWRLKVQNLLPDTFFLVARSLRAGLSLEQALETVARDGSPPLAEEFRRGVEQIKLGLAVPAALQGMARRLRLPDFDVFVTVVTLHRNMGGNLTVLLDRVAATTRDRNLFRGYFQAATALGRVTALFIAAAAPVLFLGFALWQPDFVQRFTESAAGLRALGLALALEVIGAVWLYLLLRMEY